MGNFIGFCQYGEGLKKAEEMSKIGKNPYNRILMIKEYQGITYDKLCEKLGNVNSKWDYDAGSLRKELNKKGEPNYALAEDLEKALGIKSDLDNREAVAVYYYMKSRHPHKGQPSAKCKEEWRSMYEEAQKKKGKPNEISFDEMFMNTLDDQPDIDDYPILLMEEYFLKRALLVYREDESAFDEIFEQYKDIIDWDKTDEIKITIS